MSLFSSAPRRCRCSDRRRTPMMAMTFSRMYEGHDSCISALKYGDSNTLHADSRPKLLVFTVCLSQRGRLSEVYVMLFHMNTSQHWQEDWPRCYCARLLLLQPCLCCYHRHNSPVKKLWCVLPLLLNQFPGTMVSAHCKCFIPFSPPSSQLLASSLPIHAQDF